MVVSKPVYMDNHATTRVDPRVVEAMLPYWTEMYGNSGSTSHQFGWAAQESVDVARAQVAQAVGAAPREIVFTSGATESNNLAIRGLADRERRKGDHILSVVTEHKAVLEPLRRLGRRGFEIQLLAVADQSGHQAGWLDPQQVADAIRDDTMLLSVMLVNNEIGVVQSVAEIARVCRDRGVLVHCDATQAIGKIEVDTTELGVDLMSFSAHKAYGPKGVGALYVRRQRPPIRLHALIEGGGQEGGRRGGTLNVPGIVGFGECMRIAAEETNRESAWLGPLRDRLFEGLVESIDDVVLNGPDLSRRGLRVAGNLNCSFAGVDGEALMMSMGELAVSSGSACTSVDPEPSHVLRALGLSDDQSRSSLRFGLGRFSTSDEVDFAVELLAETVSKLRRLGR